MAASTDKTPRTAAEYFNQTSGSYERLTGGCTRDAAQFVLQLSAEIAAIDSSSVVLDNACGTGIITEEILTNLDPENRPKIHAADGSPNMVSILEDKAERGGWKNKKENGGGLVQTSVEAGEELSYPDDTFTHSYTNLGILFFTDPEKGAAQIYRTLKPRGTAFVTTWGKLGYLPTIQKAQKIVRPNDKPWRPPVDEDWFTKDKLRNVLGKGGFDPNKIQIRTCRCSYRAEDLNGLLDILKGSFSKTTTEGWAEDERELFNNSLEGALSEEEKRTASIEMIGLVAVAQKG